MIKKNECEEYLLHRVVGLIHVAAKAEAIVCNGNLRPRTHNSNRVESKIEVAAFLAFSVHLTVRSPDSGEILLRSKRFERGSHCKENKETQTEREAEQG